MHKAYVLMGGNEGDVPAMFRRAVGLIRDAGISVMAEGSLYQSAAWGNGVHGTFYNQLLILGVSQKPRNLLSFLLDIESELGRERQPGKVTNRTIDIDILFFDAKIINEKDLVIPHPMLHKRRFALEPLAEIEPEFVHPVLKKTISDLYEECSDHSVVKKTD